EDRPLPENIRQILWAGGKGEFRWRDIPRLTFDLRRLTKELKPDLLHAGPIQNCTFLAALSGFQPILAMSWGYDLVMDADKSTWMRWVTRYTLKRSAFFVSDANISRMKAIEFGMDPAKTVIFPWGTDIEHFTSKTFKRSNVQTFTIFCSRSWESMYGVDVLARAFVKVANQHPNVDLILLGGGSQGPKIRQILLSGGVLDRVHFGGHVGQKDLPRWYHMADLYISPSHVDGSSVTLMEALACGLPCLVSDIPGNREWIEDGVNGWLFRDGDVNDLAEKILYAIKNRDTFETIRKAARRTAEQKADWKKNFGKLLEAYQKTVTQSEHGQ
ncbi:MAG TPA: glycosyltransferase family 4 protein, partial [Anaerolineales bacterium]|nr:glycosyltransferase family 4 protein [Anaerolineales bacterium]